MIGSIIWFLLRIVMGILFYATPVIGFWLASSLAAYLGAAPWIAWTVGALLFPIIPGILEFHAWAWRDPNKKAWFTPLDRLSLKTFAIGLTFIIALLYFYPQTAFVAIATRGDWMLDGMKDKRAETARQYLYAAANGLEWLYKYSKKNPYKDYIDAQARKRTEKAEQQVASQEAAAKNKIAQQPTNSDGNGNGNQEKNQPENDNSDQTNQIGKENEGIEIAQTSTAGENDIETSSDSGNNDFDNDDHNQASDDQTNNDQTDTTPRKIVHKKEIPDVTTLKFSKKRWPWKQKTLHPVVAKMPRSAETSISAVAKYIAAREKDPVLRIKALHDWVADRVAYDTVAFYSNNIPDQSAESTFKSRRSVCAGYANLLSALGAAINEKIIVVTGDARDPKLGDRLTGMGHAWNAAKISGQWYLIDATWDSGYCSREKGFTKAYRTEYLMPPPAVMIEDHFPEDQTWQLLAQPLSQGDFLRQPMLSPAFQSADLRLITPTRAKNEMGSKAIAVVQNPDQVWLMTGLEQNGKRLDTPKYASNNKIVRLEQDLPDKGTYRMNIFMNETNQYGSYEYVGSLDFVNR